MDTSDEKDEPKIDFCVVCVGAGVATTDVIELAVIPNAPLKILAMIILKEFCAVVDAWNNVAFTPTIVSETPKETTTVFDEGE